MPKQSLGGVPLPPVGRHGDHRVMPHEGGARERENRPVTPEPGAAGDRAATPSVGDTAGSAPGHDRYLTARMYRRALPLSSAAGPFPAPGQDDASREQRLPHVYLVVPAAPPPAALTYDIIQDGRSQHWRRPDELTSFSRISADAPANRLHLNPLARSSSGQAVWWPHTARSARSNWAAPSWSGRAQPPRDRLSRISTCTRSGAVGPRRPPPE